MTVTMKYPILLYNFLKEIYGKRFAIFELAKRDFQSQYKGSYLGIFWTYIQPFVFILLIWGVLTFGFKMQSVENTSQVYWLICGMIAWLFFAEVFSATTGVIQQYNFLIKKVDFSLGILPMVKVLSALAAHTVFIFIVLTIGFFYGIFPAIHTLQIFYYTGAMSILLVGLGWLTSSTSIFVKDVNNIVSIAIQFGFWLTPIFWSPAMIPEKYIWLVKINPLYYIISGYRDSFIYGTPFWNKPYELIYFWLVVLVILVTGAIVFRRLRPHFAEVI